MTTNETQRQHRHWSLLAAVLACGCLFSTAAHAHDRDTGFEGGLRVGYGIPLGDADGGPDSSLSGGISGQIPIQIDLGYRVIPNLTIGLYGQYGFGFVGDDASDGCDASSQISCSAHDIRLGIQAHYHFQPGQKLDPWIGLGLGYEWMGFSVEGGGLEVSSTLHGFEFFNFQAGLDIAVAEHFYIGPVLTLSFAQFSSLSIDCSSSSGLCDQMPSASGDIDEKALHEWLMIGVRGVYAP
ncbi:MAG TPA: outer membrane beta-barrel protein [Polyangiales bacterium]|nr:outer membrane beta-barrel protein [Polyangiales bacterium]